MLLFCFCLHSIFPFFSENSNPLQVLHFAAEEAKQNYKYFDNISKSVSSEPVMATVIFYLSNVSLGGQILFPESEVIPKPSKCFVISGSCC